MDFLQFLSNSPPQKQSVEKNTTTEKKINTQDICRNIKKGSFVQIIYKPNSRHNIYKGYIGEVKEYVRNQDYALIMLHALNTPKSFRFPLDHFIKLEQY